MDRVTEIAKRAVSGGFPRIIGKTELQAYQRHLNDLERQGTADFPYVWEPEKEAEIIDFAELLVLAEGDEPQPLVCADWQAFVFGSWHGWRKLDGHRRFRTSYVQVARQNGKSVGNAVPALFYGNMDGYQYPQVYCTATKEAQARIVLKECIKFIDADQELCGDKYKPGLFTVKEYKATIECNMTKGEIKALGRDTKSIDGFRPYFASVDEYHLHKDAQMYKLLTDGMKKLKSCLASVITTAGFDLNAPCYELYEYCKLILSGAHDDPTQFVFICEMDEGDDPFNEDNWQKANPIWTQTTLESLRADATKAKQMQGEELRNFLTKSLNVWVSGGENKYIDADDWKKCGSDTTIADMEGKECYAGFDLSSGGDLTTLNLEFPLMIDGVQKYFIHSHSFIPAMRLQEHIQTDKAPYDMWKRAGLLTATETLGGIKTDYKYCIAYLKGLIEKYSLKLKGIGYDPHNADAFLGDLEEFGVECVEITQSARNLNDPTVDFRLEVKAGNVIYDRNNRLLTWSVNNAVTVSNSFGEIKLDKNLQRKRIDPIDAIICSHKLALADRQEISVYETRGPRFI